MNNRYLISLHHIKNSVASLIHIGPVDFSKTSGQTYTIHKGSPVIGAAQKIALVNTT